MTVFFVKRIELPCSQHSCFAPNVPLAGVAPLVAETWMQHSSSVCLVPGETIFEAETLCEDVAGFYDIFSVNSKISFYSLNPPPSSDHPEGFERICERLTVLSALRELNHCEKLDHRILIATTFEALLGQCPLYEQIEKTEYVLTKNSSVSYEKALQ